MEIIESKSNYKYHELQQLEQPVNINNNDEIVNNMKDYKSIETIINTLKYYDNIIVNNNNENNMVKYCNERPTLLDEYIYVISNYNNEINLQSILKEYDLPQCNMNCAFLMRHNRDRNENKEEKEQESKYEDNMDEMDTEYLFYTDLLDSIHCFIYHSYDKMRFRGRIVNNKFNINIQNNNNKVPTFTDGLFKSLQKLAKIKQIIHLMNFLSEEQYESDAIIEDIKNIYSYNSNIDNEIRDKIMFNHIEKYIYNTELFKKTFNTGLRFYYWPYYAGTNANEEKETWDWNKNDHYGYKQHKLYIKAKYENIKDEILNNKTYTLNQKQYNKTYTKVNKYMCCEKVKAMIVRQLPGQKDPLKYNIMIDTPITYKHILSIVLYCDCTQLSTEFSKSFRKLTSYQSLDEIKKKNQEFAIWSRLIRETIEYYGWKRFGDVLTNNTFAIYSTRTINELCGPFYCGMSVEMVVPQINIRLSGPTSTSLHKEVAERFAGPDGMVMQLNNNGTEISGDLRGFVCKWISIYPEEEEVLFGGGEYRIRIESIIIKSTKNNYQQWFNILYFFDCMINGSILGGHYSHIITKTYYDRLNELIKHNLKIFINDWDKYVNDTFNAFVQNKTELIINIYEIHRNLNILSPLILEELTVTKMYDPTKLIHSTISNDINGRNNNMIKPIIFELFPNLININIITSQIEYVDYEFDLLQLLEVLISSSEWISNDLQIKIKTLCPSWISKQISSSNIISQYESKQFNIKSETKNDIQGNKVMSLTISKKI